MIIRPWMTSLSKATWTNNNMRNSSRIRHLRLLGRVSSHIPIIVRWLRMILNFLLYAMSLVQSDFQRMKNVSQMVKTTYLRVSILSWNLLTRCPPKMNSVVESAKKSKQFMMNNLTTWMTRYRIRWVSEAKTHPCSNLSISLPTDFSFPVPHPRGRKSPRWWLTAMLRILRMVLGAAILDKFRVPTQHLTCQMKSSTNSIHRYKMLRGRE